LKGVFAAIAHATNFRANSGFGTKVLSNEKSAALHRFLFSIDSLGRLNSRSNKVRLYPGPA